MTLRFAGRARLPALGFDRHSLRTDRSGPAGLPNALRRSSRQHLQEHRFVSAPRRSRRLMCARASQSEVVKRPSYDRQKTRRSHRQNAAFDHCYKAFTTVLLNGRGGGWTVAAGGEHQSQVGEGFGDDEAYRYDCACGIADAGNSRLRLGRSAASQQSTAAAMHRSGLPWLQRAWGIVVERQARTRVGGRYPRSRFGDGALLHAARRQNSGAVRRSDPPPSGAVGEGFIP
jgi:hypothetical protein